MKALVKILAGGVAAAALFSAAPAAAQYYPGYPGYGYGGNVVGQVLSQVLGGYGGYGYNGYGYGGGVNSQAAVGQCVNAVQARLNGGYAGYGYNPYGYSGGYGGARVLGISRVEPRSAGGLTIRGVANSGRAGYAYNNDAVDLTFKCKTDYRGFITSVSVDRAQPAYGYNNYTPYGSYGTTNPYNPYEAYGYRRY
jgi:hypothetical protein